MSNNSNLVYLCRVASVMDDKGGCRIKVVIPYFDKDKPLDDIPYVFPLLPKFMHVNPKEGEMVFVFLEDLNGGRGNRYFLGPVISQPQKMDKDDYYFGAQNLLPSCMDANPLPNPKLNPDNNGTLPNREDIAIEGRGNSDMILKPSELLLRCGYKKNATGEKDKCLVFNKEDLGYIQMKFQEMKDNKNQDFKSLINIVADRINLLSHDSRTNFNLRDPDTLITDEELNKIFKQAHQLPYGDVLVDFLKKFVRIFLTHTHPFSMDKPVLNAADAAELTYYDYEGMLSNSIRIN